MIRKVDLPSIMNRKASPAIIPKVQVSIPSPKPHHLPHPLLMMIDQGKDTNPIPHPQPHMMQRANDLFQRKLRIVTKSSHADGEFNERMLLFAQ